MYHNMDVLNTNKYVFWTSDPPKMSDCGIARSSTSAKSLH